MPRHECRIPIPTVPLATSFERRSAALECRRNRKSSSSRLGPEEQRFPGIEIPVLAVPLGREEERAEPELVVHERVDTRRQHGQLVCELVPRGILEDCQSGECSGTELRTGAFHDGASSPADVPEIPGQVEAQVSPRRFANLLGAAELSQTGERHRRRKAANGVVRGRIFATARPVHVGKRTVGGQVAKHPPPDSVCKLCRAVFVAR